MTRKRQRDRSDAHSDERFLLGHTSSSRKTSKRTYCCLCTRRRRHRWMKSAKGFAHVRNRPIERASVNGEPATVIELVIESNQCCGQSPEKSIENSREHRRENPGILLGLRWNHWSLNHRSSLGETSACDQSDPCSPNKSFSISFSSERSFLSHVAQRTEVVLVFDPSVWRNWYLGRLLVHVVSLSCHVDHSHSSPPMRSCVMSLNARHCPNCSKENWIDMTERVRPTEIDQITDMHSAMTVSTKVIAVVGPTETRQTCFFPDTIKSYCSRLPTCLAGEWQTCDVINGWTSAEFETRGNAGKINGAIEKNVTS